MHLKMSEKIDSILEERRKQLDQQRADPNVFYQTSRVDGADDTFLELRFRNGIQTAFAYQNLAWFNYDPSASVIDMEFTGFVVSIEGRGLTDLFQAIKSRRVGWVRESDTEMQDSEQITVFIKDITITPPEDFGTEEES